MPKMKTNRLAHKKLRVNAGGKVRRARAGKRHNTGKKSSKRIRQMRTRVMTGRANIRAVRGLLPNSEVSSGA